MPLFYGAHYKNIAKSCPNMGYQLCIEHCQGWNLLQKTAACVGIIRNSCWLWWRLQALLLMSPVCKHASNKMVKTADHQLRKHKQPQCVAGLTVNVQSAQIRTDPTDKESCNVGTDHAEYWTQSMMSPFYRLSKTLSILGAKAHGAARGRMHVLLDIGLKLEA